MTTTTASICSESNWMIDYDGKYEKDIDSFQQRYPNSYEKMRNFLTVTPDKSVGGRRVFPLMGDDYRGAWEYKPSVSKGTFRVLYVLDTIHRKVHIYYAGPKPNKVPRPPVTLSKQNNHCAVRKTSKGRSQ